MYNSAEYRLSLKSQFLLVGSGTATTYSSSSTKFSLKYFYES